MMKKGSYFICIKIIYIESLDKQINIDKFR